MDGSSKHMSHSEEHIDRIVHAAIERLSAGTDSKRASGLAGVTGELVLDDKVISEATLGDRLKGIQRIVVSARAVVTPSARDLLKEKNVTLVRALKAAKSGTAQLVVGSNETTFDAAGLVQKLSRRGIQAQQNAGRDLARLTSEMAEHVAVGQKIGVLITAQTAAALCLANRRRGVRAAMVENRGELNQVLQAIGANLLVIDPTRRSPLEIERLIEAFAAVPAPQCPAQWKDALE
jgi:ribose 5-phosphate isomerase RpiB